LTVPVGLLLSVPLAVGDTLAQVAGGGASGRGGAVFADRVEDESDPAIMKRNILRLSDRAISLGNGAGFPQETLERFARLRQQLDAMGVQEYAEVSGQLGPEIARADRALSRIEVAPAPSEEQRPVAPMSGGAWQYDPNDINAHYPAYGATVDENPGAASSGTGPAKVCSNEISRACSSDADSDTGTSCIDRPTNASGSGQVQIFNNCSARPDDETIKNLLIVATVFEGVAMVASRVCDQQFFGFNVSLVCIVTDLLFLVNRSFYDFESLCASRWSDAENQASYARLGHLHGDLETAQGSINTLQSGVTSEFNSLNLSINSQISSTNASIDNHFAATNTSIDNHFTSVQTQLTNQQIALLNQMSADQDLFFRAEIERVLLHRERLAIYYLPQAQGGQLERIRTIVEETIQRVEASGEPSYAARGNLSQAISDVEAGRFKRAFIYLSQAYFEAIKILGETQKLF
jgi:hypothetical protein